MGFVVPALPASAAKKATRCEAAGWAAVAGRPATLVPLGDSGLYVWNEKGTWRLAATHPDRRVANFQGTIAFDVALSGQPVGVEGRYDVVMPNKNSVSFTFKNYGGIDSIAITAPCATTATVTGAIDGQPLTAAQVFLGGSAANPGSVPAVMAYGTPLAAVPVGITVAAGAPTTAASAATSTLGGAACPVTAWPAVTAGRPTLKPRAAFGLYAWSEKSGWSVLVSGDPGRSQVFAGKVTVVAPASSGGVVVQPLGLDGRTDAVSVQGDTVQFSFRTGNNFDGFQLFAPCASKITIEATLDGVPLVAGQVFVGVAATPVAAVPFVVTR